VVQPGLIRNKQGVNLPGAKLSAPALGEADRQYAAWAAKNELDFVGLSFVRTANEVRELKAILAAAGSEAQVIAKIEKPEALENLEAIIDAADGIMVARGDLGVEIDIARVAVVQKEIIAACTRRHKPVITATQMLDSMQHSSLPTRAEVTDVANAILDGADACMLSGETAVGEYPREAVQMMHRIALATEPIYRQRPCLAGPDAKTAGVDPITEAAVHCAGQLAAQVDAKLVIVASTSGATALSLSKNRNFVPTLGVSSSEATLRRMCLYWGVIPLCGAPTADRRALLAHVTAWAREAGWLGVGDRVVLISGTWLSTTAHNAIVVHEVE
jgi:pyruvate kinase